MITGSRNEIDDELLMNTSFSSFSRANSGHLILRGRSRHHAASQGKYRRTTAISLGRRQLPQDDRYVGVARTVLHRLQLFVATTLRGRTDAAALIGEAEALSGMGELLKTRGVP